MRPLTTLPVVSARHIILAMITTLAFIFGVTLVSVRAETPLPARLKAVAVVEGDTVLLSDLFEGLGPRGSIAVFGAPAPGQAGTISARRILSAARDHGLGDVDSAGLTSVVVRRAGRRIAAEDLTSVIKAALEREHQVVANAEIELTAGQLEAVIEPGATEAPVVRSLSFNSASGRFEALISVPGSRILELQPMRVVGAVADVMRVPVLSRAVLKGDVITPADVTLERRRRSELNGDVVTSLDKLAGTVAKSALGSGTVLRDSHLQRPEAVERNAMVTMTYEAPGIQLSLRGRAMTGGAVGDLIQVQNVASKKIIEGTIIAPGRVSIAPGSLPIAPARSAERGRNPIP